jgi:hypothetical protein
LLTVFLAKFIPVDKQAPECHQRGRDACHWLEITLVPDRDWKKGMGGRDVCHFQRIASETSRNWTLRKLVLPEYWPIF